MKKWLLNMLMNLSPMFIVSLIADPVLDMLEEAVQDSSNEWDDRLALPVIAFIRAYIKSDGDKAAAQAAADAKRAELAKSQADSLDEPAVG